MDRDMDLHFETCTLTQLLLSTWYIRGTNMGVLVETVSFALAVLVVIYTVQDGKSNYLEGAMVMSPVSPTNVWSV